MSRPVVLVVAIPYVGATALAGLVEQRGLYDVIVPDFGAGEGAPSMDFDAVLSTLPTSDFPAPVVIELPASWDLPLRATVDGTTMELEMSGPDPLTEVLDLLDHHLQRETMERSSELGGRPAPAGTRPATGHHRPLHTDVVAEPARPIDPRCRAASGGP